ncbi:Gar1/Naf1 RNA binding region [Fragilaria crotonensis]|nr:Gar1/Naf1 RNA binding region [Fragilaria crotonensis]
MSSPRKRSQWENPGEPSQEDDLAVAASYAQIPLYKYEQPKDLESEPVKPTEGHSDGDATRSDMTADGEVIDGQQEGTELGTTEKIELKTDGADDDDEKSDDESEVDLTEALARMIDADEGVEEGASKKIQRPTTEHEVDPYSTPLEELQSNFQLNLTVEEEEHLRLADGNEHSASLQLCPAGHISCHMVEDRTIVVFEVFGPISGPLYTIRLPPPPSRQNKKKESTKANVVRDQDRAEDDNEISLSDTDEGETPKDKDAEVVEESPLQSDDWSATGQFTAILAAEPRQTVYYIEDEAKLLDTFAIMRNSGKGCDASNLFDEEVLNANELYFSDDEEERQFKSKKKKGSQAKSQDVRGGQRVIPGFHAPAPSQIPPPPPPKQHSSSNSRPFYQHPHIYPHPQQYQVYQPPGFQPGQPYQQPQYAYPPIGQYYNPQAGPQYLPPPPYPYPPPPDSTDESDTVYYQ